MGFWDWLGNNSGQLAILVAAIPIAWAAVRYLRLQRAVLKHRRFETYHELVKRLVQREDPNQPMMLDRQIAIVFELRNFKEYYPLTIRILAGLKNSWRDYGSEGERERLMNEIQYTIEYISKARRWARPA